MKVLGILLLIIGLIVGIIGLVGRMNASKRLNQLCGSAKQKLGELLPVLQETKASLSDIGDDGVIKESVTVMGQPQCQMPLTSPIGNMPCLYYKYRVTVVRTEYYMETETDANGNQRQVQKSRTHEDTLDSGESSVQNFVINDGTGSIIVEPQNATFEGLVKTIDKSESNYASMMNGGMLNLGRLSLNMGNFMTGMNNGMMNNGMMNNGMMQNNGMMNNGMMQNNGMMNNGMMQNNGMMNNGMMQNNGMMNNGMMNNGMMNNGIANAVTAAAAGVAMAASMSGNNHPERIKYIEEIIGLDRNLTVVGTVCDAMGEFRLRTVQKTKVIISTKSADDMLAETKKNLKTKNMMAIGGAVGLVIGIILAAIGGGSDSNAAPANNAPAAPAQEAPAQK